MGDTDQTLRQYRRDTTGVTEQEALDQGKSAESALETHQIEESRAKHERVRCKIFDVILGAH